MRTDDLYLVDVLEAAHEMRSFLAGITRERFFADALLRSAVLWQLVILSEAATKLSPETRGAFAGVPWDGIRGLRNRLIHGYFTLQSPALWDIVSKAVPALQAEAEKILRERYPDAHGKFRERQADGGP